MRTAFGRTAMERSRNSEPSMLGMRWSDTMTLTSSARSTSSAWTPAFAVRMRKSSP
jgi:hypothetical protein